VPRDRPASAERGQERSEDARLESGLLISQQPPPQFMHFYVDLCEAGEINK